VFATRAKLLLLGVLLVFQPATFGAVERWSEQASLALVTALAAVVLLGWATDPRGQSPASWLWVPVLGFAALGVLQAAPLPVSLVDSLAPALVEWRADALGETLPVQTLSAHPPSTLRSLRVLALFAGVLAAVISLASDRVAVDRLLRMVAAVALLQFLVVLYQVFTGSTMLYGFAGPEAGGAVAGTFVNHSNFAQYANLAIGLIAGLLLVRLERERKSAGKRELRGPSDLMQRHGLWIALVALGATAVLLSMSRNGVIAMAIGAVAAGAAAWRRGAASWRGWLFAVAPLAAFAALCVFGFDLVYERLATLEKGTAFADRWVLTSSTINAWRDHPVFGVGLGTHELAFPRYDTTGVSSLAQHADNDIAQLLEETGLLGVGFVVAGALFIGFRLRRLMLSQVASIDVVSFGLLFGLLAIAVQSASDFGQRVPAVATLTAITLGLVAGLSKRPLSSASGAGGPAWRPRDCVPAAIATCVVALIAIVLLTQAAAATRAERWQDLASWQSDRLREVQWDSSDDDFTRLLAFAEQHAATAPRDVTAAYALGAFRWQAMVRGAVGLVELPPEALPATRRIADDLASARRLGPTFGPLYSLEGTLRVALGDVAEGARLIELGADLAPHDAEALLLAGQVAASRGETAEATQRLTAALERNPALFEPAAVAMISIDGFERARELAGDDRGRLATLARLCEQSPALAAMAAELREESERLLRECVARPGATPGELSEAADLAFREERFDDAANLLRRALASEYAQMTWRRRLVDALRRAGDTQGALREVRVCLRLRPGDAGLRALAAELAVEASESSGSSTATP
jgi:O-antigen ligase/tetratricopeptide (TPR) repeat protein